MQIPGLAFKACLGIGAVVLAPLSDGQCEILKLTGPLPDPAGTKFGYSVSLEGDRMAVGKPAPGPTSPGSVDVFEWQEGAAAWVAVATLVASDGQPYDELGCSVAVDGDTLIAGARAVDPLGAKGAAYVFERQIDGTWLETAKLLPPPEAWAFGWSVDIDGDIIAVGAKGASALSDGKGRVITFEREGSSWVKKATLKPFPGAGGDGFGAALDLDGERLVVGASYSWTSWSPYEGLAFVFERQGTGTSWAQKATLSPADLQDNDLFGQDVALDGDRIVVGAPLYDQPTPFVGAAFVFDFVDGVWTQTAKLSPSDESLLEYFGWSVEVEGGRAIVGARADDGAAPAAGAAYVFEEGLKCWVEVEKFYGSEPGMGDSFGAALDLGGSEVLVGAPYLYAELGHPGHALLFTLNPSGPSLLADTGSVSLSQGGMQSLQLGACPAHAGDLYVVAGSATGTTPGFAFGGVPVPLNPDVYFLFTLNHPGTSPLATSLGVLDVSGKASASFSLPPGFDPSLAGLTVHHAYAVLDAATFQLQGVSAAVPLSLVP